MIRGGRSDFDYSWYTGTDAVESVTITYPTISSSQNGPGTADQMTVVFDTFGNPTWTKDANQYINYFQYDPTTGAVVKEIIDVNTADTAEFSDLPSGWSTPTGGGLNLITTFEVDALGRTTKETTPNGNVTYTVYNDAAHEVRVYPGFHTVGGVGETTGPIDVSRTYFPAADAPSGQNVVYYETLTTSATPHLTDGVPDGTETISSGNIQSLSRQLTNAASQVIEEDDYFSLSGVTYSQTYAQLGTASADSATGNFHATIYGYSDMGTLNRLVDGNGTITDTTFDDLGRVASIYVGTNDQPGTSGAYWTPSNSGTNSNMVKIQDDYYDAYNGTSGWGDGNLTRVVQYPTSSTGSVRVTENAYDWRDRLTASKAGVLLDGSLEYATPSSETDGVHRLITAYSYDNLDEVTEQDTYAADGVGVTDSLPADDLRAETIYSYDDQGRVYRTSVFSVDPTTGDVSSDSLNTDLFYDHTGQVIETSNPGGLVTKNVYDGAGRIIIIYVTDGAGDSAPGSSDAWSDASSVADDHVVTQTEYQYDDDSNVIFTITKDRADSYTDTGALPDSTSDSIKDDRISYEGLWYNAADDETADVNYGTDSGVPISSRPAYIPERDTVTGTASATGTDDTLIDSSRTEPSGSFIGELLSITGGTGDGESGVITGFSGDTFTVATIGDDSAPFVAVPDSTSTYSISPRALVTTVTYNDAEEPAVVTDPRGIESETFYDLLGRITRTVTAWDGSSDEAGSTPAVGSTENQVTDYTYNGNKNTITQTAWNKNGTNAATYQTTAYIYGVTTSTGSDINSNDLLGKIEYPDSSTGNASATNAATLTYLATSDTLTKTDQNGTAHQYSYDPLGRLTADDVTAFGPDIDTGTGMLGYSYNDTGLLYQSTSYDDATDLDVNSQERFIYDGFGNLITDYQATGAVNTSTTPKVQYVYDFSDNHDRLSELIYPNGRVLHYGYDDNALDDAISRVDYLADDDGTGSVGQHLVEYSYLGLSTVVTENRPEEGVELTYLKQSGDTLAGNDGGDQYSGLDRFGRIVDQNWIDTSNGDTVDRTQYGYDEDGNVLYERNLGPGSGSSSVSTLDTYNDLNRLATSQRGTLSTDGTSITTPSSLAGSSESWNLDSQGNWSSQTVDGTETDHTSNADNEITSDGVTYDAAGNMLTDQAGNEYTYDAWNRIVDVYNVDSSADSFYEYLPNSDQALQLSFSGGLYYTMTYSDTGQVLQEKSFTGVGGITQYVWGATYENDLILRDRDSDGNSSTGSYGKTATSGANATGLDERLYTIRDANHDVTAITNVSGTVEERFTYDPYGNVTTLNSDASSTVTESYNWLYLYQGGRLDSVDGLYLFGAREYNPLTFPHESYQHLFE